MKKNKKGLYVQNKFERVSKQFRRDRGKYVVNLQAGESVTVWGDKSLKIYPRVSNVVKIVVMKT